MAMNPVNFALACKQLMEGMSVPDMEEITGMHTTTVRRFLRELHQQGVTFISAWDADMQGKPTVRVYRFKHKPDDKDVPCPISRTASHRYPQLQKKMQPAWK